MARIMEETALNTLVSHMRGVNGALREEATGIRDRAQGIRRAHYYEGEAQIEMSKANAVDWQVSLVDKAASFIELGAYNTWAKRRLPGLHILGRAAGL